MKRSIPAIVILCMLITASMAHAQKKNYKILRSKDPKIRAGNVRSISSEVKRMLSGKAEVDNAVLTKYYNEHICFGLTNLQQGGEFGSRRIDVKKGLASAKSEAARKRAVDVMSSTTMKIAKSSNYHPMARFNALLIAGDLNTVEAADGKPAVPVKAVFDRMVVYLSPKAPDEVRMGCLIGLLRHAELGTHPASPKPLSAADRAKLAAGALKILPVSYTHLTLPTKRIV